MNEIQIAVAGDGRAYVRVIPSARNRVLLYGGALLVALLAFGMLQLYVTVLHRFEARYELRNRIDAAKIAMPDDTALNDALVEYVQTHAKHPVPRAFAQFVVERTFNEAINQHIDPFLVLAMMKVESEYDFKAQSGAGALGLLQVIPSMHAERHINTVNALDPGLNIHVGVAVLREYVDWYGGNMNKGLLQYNGSLDLPGAPYARDVLSTEADIEAFVYHRLQGEPT
jgi:soluble lytic murein transglycosylase-like protein